MTAVVSLREDWPLRRISVRMGDETPRGFVVRVFTDAPTYRTVEPNQAADADDQPLWLREDEARALYEALADHFGHSGNDTRALRRDYEAERARVDRLIGHAIGSTK